MIKFVVCQVFFLIFSYKLSNVVNFPHSLQLIWFNLLVLKHPAEKAYMKSIYFLWYFIQNIPSLLISLNLCTLHNLLIIAFHFQVLLVNIRHIRSCFNSIPEMNYTIKLYKYKIGKNENEYELHTHTQIYIYIYILI